MRTLTRYVLVQLIAAFLFTLVALTLLFVVGGAVREAVSQSLPPALVLRLIPYFLPEWLRYTVPITLLLATTSVYSQMAGSNEVLAIKSLGISPMVLFRPALFVALVLSLVTVWLNDQAMSWGQREGERAIKEAGDIIAYSVLRTQKKFECPAFSINVKRVEGRKLISPILTVKASAVTFTAEEAEIRIDRQKNVLEIILRHWQGDAPGTMVDFPEEHRLPFSLDDANRSAGSASAASALTLSTIRGQTGHQAAEIVACQREMAALAVHQMASGDFHALSGPEWGTRRNTLAARTQLLHRLEAEPYRRWAAGFSCLCFFWVGAPMAIRRRNSDFLTSFFLCFLPILIVYYPFLMYTINASKTGALPPISVWSGNAVLALWGAYLLRKVLRY